MSVDVYLADYGKQKAQYRSRHSRRDVANSESGSDKRDGAKA